MTNPYAPQAPMPAAPQYPGAPADPYAQQAPVGYPAPQPAYAPPAPAYPHAPQGFAPQPGYAPMPGYPAPQQPSQPLATGTLDSYFSQPSVGGGAALKFEKPNPQAGIPGTTHVGVVSRPITNADIQQQTNPSNGQPAFYRDGRPKFVMKVPLQVQPSPTHPEGIAQWYVAGSARDELVRAMAAAGAPEGPPEAGSTITITCTGERPSGPGMNPAKTWAVQYVRPNGAAPAAPAAPVAQAPAPAQTAPVVSTATGQPVVHQQPLPPAPPVPAPAAPQPVAQAPVAATAPAAPLPPAPPVPATAGDLSPEQQALLAQLTNQPAG